MHPTRRIVCGGVVASVAMSGMARAAKTDLAFDALGEMRTVYTRDLLAQIIAGGTRAISVTVTDPKVAAADALPALKRDIAAYDAWIAANTDSVLRATRVADIDRAVASGRIAVFYNIQNSTPAGRAPDGVAVLKGLGVTSIQLTYNDTNDAGSGCFVEPDPGLTPFGRELIARIERQRLLLDLSHAGMRTMRDAIGAASRPMIVSHTAAKALRAHRRNTTDENMRAVAAKGGLIGITQIRPFLTDARTNNLGAYFDHLLHAVKIVGVDHVAIGSDRDHRVIPDTEEELHVLLQEEGAQLNRADWPLYLEKLNGPRRMDIVRDELKRRGLSPRDIDRIMWTNLRRLYAEVIG